MKLCFVINPKSGKERSDLLIRRLKGLLDKDGLLYEFQITTKPGHAMVIAEKVAQSGLYDLIVAVGGDGTINEVVNGMVRVCIQHRHSPINHPPLGLIPAGLGNDTARGLGIPRSLKAAYRVLKRGSARYIDIGEVNGRFFINGVGVGYDGAVISEMCEIRKRGKVLSGWIYLKALMHQLWRFICPELDIEVDGASIPPRRYLLALTANGRGFGGVFNLAPMANVDDGLLDILLVEPIPRHTFLLTIPKAIVGRHLNLRGVSYFKSQKIIITSHDPVSSHIDGEFYSDTKFHIRILPKILKIVVPKPRS